MSVKTWNIQDANRAVPPLRQLRTTTSTLLSVSFFVVKGAGGYARGRTVVGRAAALPDGRLTLHTLTAPKPYRGLPLLLRTSRAWRVFDAQRGGLFFCFRVFIRFSKFCFRFLLSR